MSKLVNAFAEGFIQVVIKQERPVPLPSRIPFHKFTKLKDYTSVLTFVKGSPSEDSRVDKVN